MRASRLQLNINPLPQDWLDKPKSWTLSLTENFPMISILCPFSVRYLVTNSPMVPAVTSTRSCRMNFAADPVRTQTQQFMDLGFSTINSLNGSSGLSTPATRIRRPTDGAHWSAPNHFFGESTSLVMSEEKSDYYYNYNAKLQIWKENKEYERQDILMGQPPLDSTRIGTNTKNTKILHLDSNPVCTKTSDTKTPTLPTESPKRKKR